MQIPIESLNLLMLNVGYAKHDGDWNWKNVSSPFTRIYYVTEGNAKIHLHGTPHIKHDNTTTVNADGFQTINLTPGHLYIVPAYTTHSYECEGKFNHYYLHVYEGFKADTDIFDFYDFPSEVDGEEGDENVFEKLCECHPEAALPESDPLSYDNNSKFTDYVHRYNDLKLYEKMNIRGVILILFSRFMHSATPRIWTKDERISKVLKYIHANIYDNIDIESLADVACVTKPYLIRLFKRDFGISPLQYINQKKVEKAQLLLLTNNIPIKEVAYSLGFSDHSYFIRMFKKMTGSTPQAYRDTMR